VAPEKALASGCRTLLNRPTMRRICVIGDSHSAALKLGWESIRAGLAGVQIDFYAAPKPHMAAFAAEGGKLVATSGTLKKFLEQTSGGRFSIDGSYSLYLVCGIGAGLEAVAPGVKRLVQRAVLKKEKISDDQLNHCLIRQMRDLEACVFLEKLRGITEAPIGLIARPLRSDGNFAAMLRAKGEEQRVAELYAECFDSLVRKRSRARFLSQPIETLGESPLSTAERFFRRPARIAVQGAEDDGSHANGEYGAIVLRSALTRMGALG
jgi:hypothetical protein